MKTVKSALLTVSLIAALTVCLQTGNAQTSGAEFKTEPDKMMAKAHESFVKGETRKAAEQIDKAADYVKKQSHEVAQGSKADMAKAAAELDKLGEGVKQGTVKSGDELKKTFAQVDHQMAGCWHTSAEAAQKTGKDSTADLKKAGTALEGAAKWSGNQLDEGTQKTVEAVKKAKKETGAQIKAGAQDVDKWTKDLGHGIEDLGHKLW